MKFIHFRGLAYIGAIVLAGVLIAVLTGGSSDPKPVTTATLIRAAHIAQVAGYGYDYGCAVYQAPRQLRCDGQGPSVLFLVDASGSPRLEPNQ